jgi:DNA-binding transcriptional MerR regulator
MNKKKTIKNYRTNEIAKIIGIHSNTVRKYEEWEFITQPMREKNGYRIFDVLHIYQFKFARLALKCEIVENGLRKDAIEIIKTLAKKDYNLAIALNEQYILKIIEEEKKALKAINTVDKIIKNNINIGEKNYTMREVLQILNLKPDTLRNWERNSLIKISKKVNGYKIYNEKDIQVINIIRTLRLANYSLSSILRMINKINNKENIDLKTVIDKSDVPDEIVSACDRLLSSLNEIKIRAFTMREMLKEIKIKF